MRLQGLFNIILITIFLGTSLGGCAFPQVDRFPLLNKGWTQADIIYLAQSPILDNSSLVAFYQRINGNDLEFRLDMLDMGNPEDYDVYLAIDYKGGGNNILPIETNPQLEWDFLLKCPSEGKPILSNDKGRSIENWTPRIVRDTSQDAFYILLPREAVPASLDRMKFQAFLTLAGKNEILASTPIMPVSPDRIQPARMLLSFWNTLPAFSPAMALRRWDGAHTGPFGQRHGLSILVKEATSRNIPLFLLDLKSSQSLNALNSLGGADLFRRLERKYLLTMPQVGLAAPGGLIKAVETSNYSANQNNLRISQFGFISSPDPLSTANDFLFADMSDTHRVTAWNNQHFIPLPSPIMTDDRIGNISLSVDANGLSVAIKKALLQTVVKGSQGLFVSLGGDLTQSPWADASIAPTVFEYISNHPWIDVLDEIELGQLPTKPVDNWPGRCQSLLCDQADLSQVPYTSSGEAYPSGRTVRYIQENLARSLKALPPLSNSPAWNAFQVLTNPLQSPTLHALSSQYIGEVGYLVEYETWAHAPYVRADCSGDFDYDGLPECILANQRQIAIVKPDTGCMVLRGVNNKGQPSLQVAPPVLFSPGLTDPSSWSLKAGPFADPGGIPGAFCFPDGKSRFDDVDLSDGKLMIQNSSGQRLLFFQEDNELEISVGSFSGRMTFPFFTPQLNNPILTMVAIDPPLPQTWTSSFESQTYLSQPEIPDRSYPPGHFQPWGFTFLTIHVDQETKITLK